MSAVLHITSPRALTTIVSPYEFPMQVEYEFDPGEPSIFWPTERAHPGSPPNAELLSCKVSGVDIYRMLSPDQIERVEDAILEQHE